MVKKIRLGDHVDYGGYICIDYEITDQEEIRALYERSDAKRYTTYDMFNQMLRVIEADEGAISFSLLFFMDCEDEKNISCRFVYGNRSSNLELDEQEEKAVKRMFESKLKKTVYKDLDGCHKAYDETHSASYVSAF